MNKEKLSKTINLLMHQNLCVVNNGTKEKPDFVVGGTELLNKGLTKLFSLYGVVKSLPSKEEIISKVYNKVFSEELTFRKVFRDETNDAYYSGALDMYDEITK